MEGRISPESHLKGGGQEGSCSPWTVTPSAVSQPLGSWRLTITMGWAGCQEIRKTGRLRIFSAQEKKNRRYFQENSFSFDFSIFPTTFGSLSERHIISKKSPQNIFPSDSITGPPHVVSSFGRQSRSFLLYPLSPALWESVSISTLPRKVPTFGLSRVKVKSHCPAPPLSPASPLHPRCRRHTS